MSDGDLMMARGNVEGGWNLAVGEPVIVQEWLKFQDLRMEGPWQYPSIEGDPQLLEQLHEMYPGKEVVVTCGAKQALAAVFYAHRNVYSGVYHAAPYWPSIPTLARMAQRRFVDQYDSHSLRCCTFPNNPDGSLAVDTQEFFDVWDAVYASKLYGWDGKFPRHHTSIHSAAKLLGLSGLRVGWLVTQNPLVAQQARAFVEFTTSGVSVPAQQYCAAALRQLRCDLLGPQMIYLARQEMLQAGKHFMSRLGQYCDDVQGVPAGGAGMFAWFHVEERFQERFVHALQESRVAMVTGEACGMPLPGWYRANMAHNYTYTANAIKALKEKLP